MPRARSSRQHRLASGERLEAVVDALADVPRGGRADGRHVADLPGPAGGAPVEAVAQHDRRADARVDPEQHEIAVLAVGAFGQRDQVDVVLHVDRRADAVGEGLDEVGDVPAAGCGRRSARRAGARVDRALDADHDPVDPGGARPRPGRCGPCPPRRPAPARGRQGGRADDRSGEVGHGDLDPVAGHVEGRHVGRPRR